MSDLAFTVIEKGITLALWIKAATEGYKENSDICQRIFATIILIEGQLNMLKNNIFTSDTDELQFTQTTKNLYTAIEKLVDDLEAFKIFYEKHQEKWKATKFLLHEVTKKEIDTLHARIEVSYNKINIPLQNLIRNEQQHGNDALRRRISDIPDEVAAKVVDQILRTDYEVTFKYKAIIWRTLSFVQW